VHPLLQPTLLVVPHTGDQLIHYELAPFYGWNLAHIHEIFKDGLAAVAVLLSAKQAVHQVYDEVPLKALTPVFLGQVELMHSSEFHGILLEFPFL